ncbi:Rieske (2Fe-2S) protein [Streptomyces sp. NPDC008313]|uniref:Rieske (2Fe-2S) protein n=1 Tax=Streptomyces sp. NPDC008313 TaxID=3364826 RepID=UPI0036F05FEF
MTDGPARRTVLATSAATLLAGCGSSGDGNGDDGGSSATPTASKGAGGKELASTADIPVGGGKIFPDEKVVVTQPREKEFKAFSAVCTHMGCTVGSVTDGTIDCPCHGSRYRIEDASVARGPATKPLPPRRITVTGNSIRLA